MSKVCKHVRRDTKRDKKGWRAVSEHQEKEEDEEEEEESLFRADAVNEDHERDRATQV